MNHAVIIVLGGQRSGTTLLNKQLEESGEIKSYGEIFHHKAGLDRNGRYFAFKLREVKANESRFMPTAENQAYIWDKYIENEIYAKSDGKIPLLDIKYNSWHHLDPVWHDYCSTPYLSVLINNNKYLIIHVYRLNIFEQACSQILALKTGKYHSFEYGEIIRQKIKVDIQQIIGYMNKYKHYRNYYRKIFDNTNVEYLEVTYEDISRLEKYNTYVLPLLEEKLKIQIRRCHNHVLKKVSPLPCDWLENYIQIKNELINMGYETSMFRTNL